MLPPVAATKEAFVRVSPRDPRYFELSDGTPPEPVDGAEIDLVSLALATQVTIRTYDPWADRWAEATQDGTTVRLPPFRRSLGPAEE